MNNISEIENFDILLVLASAFENTIANSSIKSLSVIVENSFRALPEEKFLNLKSRATFLDGLPKEKKENWRDICLEKILRRGKANRLDENINPVHIGRVLSREPKPIQKHILRNLPNDLGQRIAQYLELKFDSENEKLPIINKDIDDLVKLEFLSNFVSIEDIFEPTELDRLTVFELSQFIHHLGLREIAIASRGINSKETLAAFLNVFSSDNTKEIVRYLTELEKIKPYWVSQADELVRENWERENTPDKVLEIIGFKLLAIAYTNRHQNARKYTLQKFSTKDSQVWNKVLKTTEKEFTSNEANQIKFERRTTIIEKLAVRFLQTGRL